MRRLALLAARAILAGFYLVTALYCLLCYLPFTYHEFRAGGLVGWLDVFLRIHPWLNLAMLVPAAFLINEAWRHTIRARWLGAAFGICQLGLIYTLIAHPLLPHLENDWSSLAWSVAFLGYAASVAALDLAGYAGVIEWAEKPQGRGSSHLAACCGALLVSGMYAIVFLVRQSGVTASRETAVAAAWSLLAHLLVFLGVFLLLDAVSGVARLFHRPARVEFWLCHVILAGAIGYGVQSLIWPAVGFEGPIATAYALALGISLAAGNAGSALWLSAAEPVADGFAAAAAPVTLGLVRSWRSGLAGAGLLALFGIAAALQAAALDWNYLLQKLTATVIWLASFACFYMACGRTTRRRSLAWLLAPVALLAAYKAVAAAAPLSQAAQEEWAGYDASFRLARQFLTPAESGQESFYRFLSRNTNIAADVDVKPVPVELAASLARSGAPLPHIFFFTIDSLRRDYLSPYNPAVDFTPAIAAFARESTVFTNAFTRYGGTGLSEPAIWSGSMLLHKQYVIPFAPMNALEKLVNADQYQLLLSRDSILDTILQPAPAAVILDPPAATMNLDFAQTLEKLKTQIDTRGADGRPLFVYTQPQNLHISVIHRAGDSVPAGEAYPGFNAPYASRVKRVDAAFGSFIDFLKARGLYEHSVIVLTADHGDSLGEEGRWGHAYTLFPEIVRIPLLIHLPDELRNQLGSDPQNVAFSTDITPSLYYLLGHRPVVRNDLYGVPLFTQTPAERQRDASASYLLASSYAAVYGVLSQNGRQLYIADGVNYQNHLFELNGQSAGSRSFSAPFRQGQERLIRERIAAINRFYHLADPVGGGR